jgi:hypothetical protein
MLLESTKREMEEMLEEGVKRGMDLGREEGYTVAKKGFDGIVKALKARETVNNISTSAGTQTEPQFNQSNDMNIQTDPLPLVQQHPTIVDIPSPLLTQSAPKMSITTSSETMTLELGTPIVFEDVTPPIPPLNWANNVASLPTQVLPSPLPPRDFLGLRSPNLNPFSSLQHRSKRLTHYSRHSRRSHSRFNFNSPHYDSFKSFRPHFQSKTYSHLHWESDPRLSDLSRSLKALGWIRAS